MVERREDLALELQPALNVARQQAAPHQLDRDLLLELLVGALREEHLAHAAAAEAAHDAIRTDALAGEVDRCFLVRCSGAHGAVVAEPLLARFELVHCARVQIAVAGARLANEAQPLVRRQGLRLFEELLQGLGRHCAHLKARCVACPSVELNRRALAGAALGARSATLEFRHAPSDPFHDRNPCAKDCSAAAARIDHQGLITIL